MTSSTARRRIRTRFLRVDERRHGFFHSRPPSEGRDGRKAPNMMDAGVAVCDGLEVGLSKVEERNEKDVIARC